MIQLDQVRREEFDACLEQEFAIETGAAPLVVHLQEARPGSVRPGAIREPFALTFRGPPGLRLPQGIYRMRHAQLGEMEIFIVQVGSDAAGSYFEAIFN